MTEKKKAAVGAANAQSGRENNSTASVIPFYQKVNREDSTWQAAEAKKEIQESARRGRELLTAMLEGVPVDLKTLGGLVRYGWISGLIYRLYRNKLGETTDQICMRVELTDCKAASIAVAAPRDVLPVWQGAPPTVSEDPLAMIHGDAPVDVDKLKAALASFHTVRWNDCEFRSVRAVIFRPDGSGGVYVTVDLADLSGEIVNVPADQIEITDHLWNR